MLMGLGMAAYGAYSASRKSTTGSGKAILNAIALQKKLNEMLMGQSVDAANQFFDMYMQMSPEAADMIASNIQRTSEVSPVFKALQEKLVGELDSGPSRGAEKAVMDQVRQGLAARGTLGSAATVVPESMAMLNFKEQHRQTRVNDALNFLRTGSPTAVGETAWGQNLMQAMPTYGNFAGQMQSAMDTSMNNFGWKRAASDYRRQSILTQGTQGYALGRQMGADIMSVFKGMGGGGFGGGGMGGAMSGAMAGGFFGGGG